MAHASSSAAPTDHRTGQYVVVARRYRPKAFDELIGQGHVAKALTSAISAGRVGHAYLFTGARGVGKTSAARILAKALDCASGPTPTPCGECEICLSVGRGDDIDVLEIDGASNRGIDEIRQLRQNAGVRPSRARFKIYIIDEVHMLTKEAFNALLKTLEEPPEHVKFIFATTEPNKIPITILSRCQRFDFAGIDAAAIEARLGQIAAAEGIAVEAEALQLLARRAAGSMRDSQSLLEQLLSLGQKSISAADVDNLLGTAPASRLARLVEGLIQRDPATALGELDSAVAQGVDVGQLLDQLLGYFRDMMAAAVGCPPKLLLHTTPAQHDELRGAAEQLGVETLLVIVQILEHAVGRMRDSMHGRTLAELALVRICRLEALDDISALIEALGSGPPGGSGNSAKAGPALKKNGAPVPSPAAPRSTPAAQPAPGTNPTGAPAEDARTAVPFYGPLTADSATGLWRHVLKNLGEMVAVQGEFAQQAAYVEANRLAVTFRAKYTSCKEFCERPQHKAKLEAALQDAAGEAVRIEFRLLPDEPSQAAAGPNPRANLRKYQAEIAERPIVRRAKELFGAEQIRVDPPADNPR